MILDHFCDGIQMDFHFLEVDLLLLIQNEIEYKEATGDMRKALNEELLSRHLGNRKLEVRLSLEVDVFLPMDVELLEYGDQVRVFEEIHLVGKGHLLPLGFLEGLFCFLGLVEVIALHHLLQEIEVSQDCAYLTVGVVHIADDEIEHRQLLTGLAKKVHLGKGIGHGEFLYKQVALLHFQQVNYGYSSNHEQFVALGGDIIFDMIHIAKDDWEDPHIQLGVFEDPLKLLVRVEQPERVLHLLEGLSVPLGNGPGQVHVEGEVEVLLVDVLNDLVQNLDLWVVWLSNQLDFSNFKDFDSGVDVLDLHHVLDHEEVVLLASRQYPQKHGVVLVEHQGLFEVQFLKEAELVLLFLEHEISLHFSEGFVRSYNY